MFSYQHWLYNCRIDIGSIRNIWYWQNLIFVMPYRSVGMILMIVTIVSVVCQNELNPEAFVVRYNPYDESRFTNLSGWGIRPRRSGMWGFNMLCNRLMWDIVVAVIPMTRMEIKCCSLICSFRMWVEGYTEKIKDEMSNEQSLSRFKKLVDCWMKFNVSLRCLVSLKCCVIIIISIIVLIIAIIIRVHFRGLKGECTCGYIYRCTVLLFDLILLYIYRLTNNKEILN